MSIDRALAIAGLTATCISAGLFWLIPTTRWPGWVFLGLGVTLLIALTVRFVIGTQEPHVPHLPIPSQTLSQTAVNAPHFEFNPHNEFKPTININQTVEESSTLKILFEPDSSPFIQLNIAHDGSPLQKLYRVGVMSSVTAEVVLRANNVKLGGGGPYSNIPLHVMHDARNTLKRVKLYPGVPDYWDVVLVGAETNSVNLYHIQQDLPSELSPHEQEFQLLAVTDKGPPDGQNSDD